MQKTANLHWAVQQYETVLFICLFCCNSQYDEPNLLKSREGDRRGNARELELLEA